MSQRRLPNAAIWRAPVAIGAASAVGLVAALIADGPWDTLSTLCLGLPVAVCAWFSVRRQPP